MSPNTYLACMQASKLPPAVDRAWEKIGGGPADLYFPEEFLGVWNVESTLTSIKLPLGTDYVPDLKVGFNFCLISGTCDKYTTFCVGKGIRNEQCDKLTFGLSAPIEQLSKCLVCLAPGKQQVMVCL